VTRINWANSGELFARNVEHFRPLPAKLPLLKKGLTIDQIVEMKGERQ
jgi:hypothetical protein